MFSLDYWTFGAVFPAIQDAASAGLTVQGNIAAVLYGGVIEEVMLRLFVMSLLALILWKVFARKQESAPAWTLATANVVAAVLFAAGHLPATAVTFGSLSPLLLFRCFLLNGGFAMVFGYLYRKHGILYAMISHAALHIVSRVIWVIFA
ncbi:MAG: CPBP family intramembrane metalloprotease [Clostridia bacterium]|nr:CPBP family intramembrane metalloprotease [Clostridia bacterium]